jgi:hypothetical protein
MKDRLWTFVERHPDGVALVVALFGGACFVAIVANF